jgi:hypothetical protein
MIPSFKPATQRGGLPYSRFRLNPSLLWTCVFFLLCFLFLRPYYLTNDDSLISFISWGFTAGSPSEFLIHINVLVGLALKELQGIWPTLHGYGLFLMGLFFFSTWAIVESSRSLPRLPRLGVLSLIALTLWHYFSHLQYTLLAFWAAQAGLFLVFNPFSPKLGRSRLVVGGLLLFFSGLLRLDATFLALAAFIPVGLFTWFSNKPTHRWKQTLWLLTVLALLAAASAYHRFYYDSRPGWKGFYPWMKSASRLVEYRGLSATGATDKSFQSVGWDSLDYALLANRYWQEPKLSLKNLQALDKKLPAPYVGKGLGWVDSLQSEFVQVQGLFLALVLLLLPRKRWGWLLLNALGVFLLILYLYYFMKLNPWVVWPLVSYLSLSSFLFLSGGDGKPNFPPFLSWGAWVLWLMLAVPLMVGDWRQNQGAILREEQFQAEIAALGLRPDSLYVVWDRAVPFESISVFGNLEPFRGNHLYWLSWWQNSPEARALLQKFNLTNPFRDMVNRGDVYLILPENFSTLFHLYLRERFHIEPEFQPSFRGILFSVYHVKGKGISHP